MLIDTLLSTIAPHECLNCSAEGKLLCDSCVRLLDAVPEACYRCRKLSSNGKTCKSCRASTDLYIVRAATIYKGLAKELVWQLKFQGAQAAAREIATQMAVYVPGSPEVVLIPVPTATSRIRRRGYDQATLIARILAAETGTQYCPALRRSGQHHQLGSSRTRRVTQLQDAYRCVRPKEVAGKHVILIDDVLTTGATLEAAARIIKAAGAKRVSGIVYARA
jgi:ComF family protein